MPHTGGWHVCVPGTLHTWANGPLQVWGEVGQVWKMPLHCWACLLPQVPALQTGVLLQAPAPPLHAEALNPTHDPMTAPLQAAGLAPWQFPGSLSQVWS